MAQLSAKRTTSQSKNYYKLGTEILLSDRLTRLLFRSLRIRYKDPVDHNTSKNSSGNLGVLALVPMRYNRECYSGAKRKKKGYFEVDESLFAYEDVNNYDMLLNDEFTTMHSPAATAKVSSISNFLN